MSTILPAAISNEYIFISAVTAYAFKQAAKNEITKDHIRLAKKPVNKRWSTSVCRAHVKTFGKKKLKV